MLIVVDGKEYRVHMHMGQYSQVYVRIRRTATTMMRGGVVGGIVERRVKFGGATWHKVVTAHKAALNELKRA